MSVFLLRRSRAWRMRVNGEVVDEHFGALHAQGALLEWGSVTKTVTAALAHQLARVELIELNAPVSD